jgi:O-antigen biosynthesis protein
MVVKGSLQAVKPSGRLSFHTYLGDWSGCGHIRVIFPGMLLSQYRHKGMSFTSTHNSSFVHDVGFYQHQTFIKFQRAATEAHLALVTRYLTKIKPAVRRPIVYEVDDLLSPDIPRTNYAHDYYKQNWDYVRRIMSMVDGVVVSTEPLKREYMALNPNIQVIPNSLPKFLWGDVPVDYHKESGDQVGRLRILWAGSQNHFSVSGGGGDFGPLLLDFIRKTTDRFRWVFVGALPNELKGAAVEFHPWQTITALPGFLRSLKPDLGIAPLENNLFNECKSNIKMLEFTALGIPGVYTDIYPYREARFTARTEEYMIDTIERIDANRELLHEGFVHDYRVVRPRLFWEENDNLRRFVDIHLRLFGKKLG